MKLEPRMVAAVSGAASGIGRAIAIAFAQRGLSVALMDIAVDELAGVAQEVGASGVDVACLEADVRSLESMRSAAAAATERLGRVDVVCNNAGVLGPWRPVWQQEPNDWGWVLEVNLLGVINGIAAFAPAMVERNSGYIVNTSSINAFAPLEAGGNAPYAASKAAVVALTETLRTDLDRTAPAVGCSVLCPGPVETRIRESERSRPYDLMPSGPTVILPPGEFDYERLTPDTVAERTIEGIEDGRLYILPNRGSEVDALRHFQKFYRTVSDEPLTLR